MPKPRTDKRLLMLLMITMGCSRQAQVRRLRKLLSCKIEKACKVKMDEEMLIVPCGHMCH